MELGLVLLYAVFLLLLFSLLIYCEPHKLDLITVEIPFVWISRYPRTNCRGQCLETVRGFTLGKCRSIALSKNVAYLLWSETNHLSEKKELKYC